MSICILIKNATNLPNKDAIGTSDPYVTVHFQGQKGKTEVKRSTLDPEWNEEIKFELGSKPIQSDETIDIEVKDYERIGWNKLLGKTVLPLRNVIQTGTSTSQLEVDQTLVDENDQNTNAKLSMSVTYTPNTTATTSQQPELISQANNSVEGDTSEGIVRRRDDLALQGGGGMPQLGTNRLQLRNRDTLSNIKTNFQIRVRVVEARQLLGDELSPVCRVVYNNRIQQTKILRGSASPWFDQLFFFYEENLPQNVLENFIEFKVCNSRVLRSESIIGSYKCELGQVYDHPDHAIINKWLVLAHPDEPTPTVQGYLKVSIAALGPGDVCPDMTASVNDADDIESNLLWSAGMHLQPASFILSVYLAQNLPRMDSGIMQTFKEVLGFGKASKELVDPYVVASFAGREVQTKIFYNDDNPVFKQKINLGFLFPSMCNTLKLSLMDWDKIGDDDVIGSAVIPITEISAPGDEGFLPTFGPCFVNVYGARREWELWDGNTETKMNKGETEGCSYRGRVLVSLETCVGSYPSAPTVNMDDIAFNEVKTFRSTREFVIVAHMTHAFLLKEANQPLEIEVSMGTFGNKLENTLLPSPSSSHPSNPVFDGCKNYYLPWGETVPLVMVECEWEDVSTRLMASNALLRIAEVLEKDVLRLKTVLITKKANASIISSQIKRTLMNLQELCRQPLPKPDPYRQIETTLDLALRTQRQKELERMCQEVERLIQKDDTTETLEELQVFLNKIKELAKEPQVNMPDIFLWLMSGAKRLAFARIPVKSILHSNKPQWAGLKSGKFDSVMLKYPDDPTGMKIGGIIRCSLWFGRVDDLPSWWDIRQDLQLTVFAETYENQILSAPGTGKWTNKGALLRRPSFSDADGLMSLPKEQFRPSPGWKFQGNWFVDPDPSTKFSSDAGHTIYCEEVFQQQVRVPGGTWLDIPQGTWANGKGDPERPRDEIKCPTGWEWRDVWMTDLQRAVDSEGWEYTVKKGMTGWSPLEKLYHVLRRRRWIRERTRVGKVKNEEKSQDGWEYSTLFGKKFHSHERAIDIVRRRRWRRKLVPVGEGTPETPRITVASELGDEEKPVLNICPRLYTISAEIHTYQLRAHLYQARDVISGDKSGLSDPYAIVTFCGHTQQTEKRSQTLSPTWDQTLVFDSIKLSGPLLPKNEICTPPSVIVEIFDWDSRGEPEFLGRTVCGPVVLNPKEGYQPPKLQWFRLQKGTSVKQGELLAAFELLLKENDDLPMPPPAKGDLFMVPFGVRPILQKTRIEILCWGVRNMSTYELQSITRPSIEFECGGQRLTSTIMKNIRHNPNFDKPHLIIDVELPKEELYMPPLSIRVMDHRSFGSKPLVASASIINLHKYNVEPKSARKNSALNCTISLMKKMEDKKKVVALDNIVDWWAKYYASINDAQRFGSYLEKGHEKLEVINGNLESDSRYNSFRDLIDTIQLYRGKMEDCMPVGEFKGTFRMYPLTSDEEPPKVLEGFPSPDPQEIIVRVYVISARDLAPKDSGSTSDPYVVVRLGKQTQKAVDDYKPATLNPIFGKLFEVKAKIPLVKDLIVQVWDRDTLSSDDLIGQTTIDLENRFLTRYRASVGLAKQYHTSGPNTWRDLKLPSEILEEEAKIRHLDGPHLDEEAGGLTLDGKMYLLSEFEPPGKVLPPTLGSTYQRLCLHVLQSNFTLVNEHVEERPLMHSERPDLPQGTISLWVDMFPSGITLPPPVDITPREAVKYLLRICIYNVYEVPLDETNLAGEQMSDVYVKGWIEGTNYVQKTDIHYRCMDGEANFNWRLVYHFNFLEAEQMVLIKKKKSVFSSGESEERRPPQVTLQLWDDDLLLKDDYLSEMTLNLCSIPKPSKSLKKVALDYCLSKSEPIKINLFETKRLYGYFPFGRMSPKGTLEMAGKLEAEFEVLTESEADIRPAGQGRDTPNSNPTLAEPNRPATSFLWITSPWKSFKFILWKNYKWYFITFVVMFFLLLFILLFLYAVPGATIESLIH